MSRSAEFERCVALLVKMLAPLAPMFASELWSGLQQIDNKLADLNWVCAHSTRTPVGILRNSNTPLPRLLSHCRASPNSVHEHPVPEIEADYGQSRSQELFARVQKIQDMVFHNSLDVCCSREQTSCSNAGLR